MRHDPPRAAEALLRVFLGSEDAEVIGGDLDETFHETAPRIGAGAARRWYWRQARCYCSWSRSPRRSALPDAPRGSIPPAHFGLIENALPLSSRSSPAPVVGLPIRSSQRVRFQPRQSSAVV